MSAKSHSQGHGVSRGLLAAVTLVATTSGCGLVAGIDDRELYAGPTGGQGGTTSSGSGGQGGEAGGGGSGGATGGSGGTIECPTHTSNWPDSSKYCFANQLTCHAGEDGAIQLATPSYDDSAGAVVYDQVTGLYWEKTAHDDGNVGPYSWAAANSDCNGLSLNNMHDWRVPLLRELVSLADFGLPSPMIAEEFSQTPNMFWAWENSGNYRWGVHFDLGGVTYWSDTGVAADAMVRCVHGGPSISNLEVGSTGETVIDLTLGLEWMMGVQGELDWEDSLNYCLELTDHGGCWRAPNVKELLTIYKPAISPSFPDEFGDQQPLESYWSSTADQSGEAQAYAVHYDPDDPAMGAARREPVNTDFLARCVRTPQ